MVLVVIACAIINATSEQYSHDPFANCGSHVFSEYVLIALLIIGYVVVFGFLLITIRNMKDSYGVKTQFKGIIAVWIVILILFGIFSSLPNSSEIGHHLYQAFSSYCYLLPAFFELAYPLYKSYQLDWEKLHDNTSTASSYTTSNEEITIPTEFVDLFEFAGATKEKHDSILLFFSEYLEAEEFINQNDKDQYLHLTRMLSEMIRFQEEQKKLIGAPKAQLEFQYHAKACIWYQRFLKEGAYFPTHGLITEKQSADLQSNFNNWTEDNTTLQQQTKVIIDQVQKNAVEQLETIRRGFFSSPCYYSYRQQVADATTLSRVVTQSAAIPLQNQ